MDMVHEFIFIPGNGRACPDYKILPHGFCDIVFAISDTVSRVVVHGPRTRAQDIPGHDFDLAIIRFKAGGLPGLLDGRPLDFVDETVELPRIFGRNSHELCDILRERESSFAKRSVLEGLLLQNDLQPLKENSIIGLAGDVVGSRRAVVTVSELARHLNVSIRTLERKFEKALGFSPKQFIRLIRFQETMKSLIALHSHTSFVDLAYAAGYCDQSHLIKEFKLLSGMSPEVFLKNPPCGSRKMVALPFGRSAR